MTAANHPIHRRTGGAFSRMDTQPPVLGDRSRYVQRTMMKFRLRSLSIATALLAHICAKQSWTDRLCADGSAPVTTVIPFAIQTEFDDGEYAHRRTYLGALGKYKLISTSESSIYYSGTRYCYVPKLYEIDGAKLDVMVRGDGTRFVHLSGMVQSESGFESAIAVLDEHDWAGATRAYIDVAVDGCKERRTFWYDIPRKCINRT